MAGGLLVLAAVLGHAGPLLAQDGVGIAFDDLSSSPTETGVDGFYVQLTNLDADVAYQVVVASDNAAAVGVGACGTATQTRSVTGATARDLKFSVYACAVAPVTLTAEVRAAGAATAAASVRRALTVLAFPVGAPAGVRGVRTTSRGATQAGAPGLVPSISFDNIRIDSVRANWRRPNDGDLPLTGYGVLFWKQGTDQPPWDQADTIGVTLTHTFTGLEYATTYKFRIHACNGDDSCGIWTDPPVEVSTARRPDPPHTIKFTSSTASSVRVTWSIAANTGGVPLTGIDLKYWPYDAQNPDRETGAKTHPADDGNDRGETLRGLAAGTEYELKMRACNGTNDSHCSRWSSDHRFTTLAGTTPPPTPTATPTPTPTPEAPKPQNLNVVPRAGRKVVLTWDAVAGAARYEVQARVLGPSEESGWHAAECQGVTGDGPIQRRCEIELEHITTVDGIKLGLQNHEAYALQVRVLKPQKGDFSATVILIDTPITKANGANSQAEITWQPVNKAVTHLGANFKGGSYQLRYRKADADVHRKRGWTPGQFEDAVVTLSTTEQILDAGQDSELRVDVIDAISTVNAGPLYAVQLVYKDDQDNSQDADVFAAREVYVSPSSSEPAAYSYVGGLSLEQRLPSRDVAYRICGDSFGPSGNSRRQAWEALIENAFGQWTTATDGLVSFLPPVDGCATDDVSKDTYVTIKENLKDILGNNLTPTLDPQIEIQVRSYVNGLRRDGITSRLIEDSHKYSEVYMFDDMALGPLIRAYVFRDIAGDIGYGIYCWFNPSGAWAKTRMCTGSIKDDEGSVVSTDIIVRRGAYDAGLWSSRETGELSDDLRLPLADARFGTCFNDNSDDWKSAYTDMVHEVGHLIGIAEHPQFADTVMNYDNVLPDERRQKEPDCSPHPIDIMAVYALYQTGF